MRNCLLFVLLLNVVVFANDCNIRLLPAFTDSPEKQTLANVRDSLLSSLQAQDSSEVFRYVSVLKNSGYGERALDNYELLQIYLMMNQYDSALVTLVREHFRYINESYDNESGVCSNRAPYSAFDDELIAYANRTIHLTTEADFQKQLDRISDGATTQEYKDFTNLLKIILKNTRFNHISKRSDYYAGRPPNRDSFQQARFDGGSYTKEDFNDSHVFDSLIEKLIAFKNKYPESEFNPWIMKQVELKKDDRESDLKKRHYYYEFFYTGGIGGEFFISPLNGSYEWNVVLQIKRFILTANYGRDDDFIYDGWNFLLGVDVFENRFFKIVSFVGGSNPLMAGMQFEFRPWISELGREVPIGSYLSIKAKYVFKYGEKDRKADDNEKHSKHKFYLGVGFHIW
ncbi:hypothetical protein [Fibrobacter sp. UWB11]|uniref:hypothetical protein n=1 Tax=Fibrobacter sp. UWB11 TaxID=1896202 RepID=UPI0009415B16|nr:hypothetical protein [Fibrobacter sp. UWB11]